MPTRWRGHRLRAWEDAPVATPTGDPLPPPDPVPSRDTRPAADALPDRLDVLAGEVGAGVEADLERQGLIGLVADRARSGAGAALRVPARTRDKVAELVDAALDRIYANPMDVPTAEIAAQLLDELGEDSSGREASKQVAGALATLGPVLTRIARGGGRIAAMAAVGTKFVPTGRAVALSTTAALGAIRIGASSRVGTKELQVLASYAVSRLRASGLDVDRAFVEHLTIQAYVQPDAPVQPHRHARPGYTALARTWTKRAFRPHRDGKRRALNRKRVTAIERLDLAPLHAAWSAQPAGKAR